MPESRALAGPEKSVAVAEEPRLSEDVDPLRVFLVKHDASRTRQRIRHHQIQVVLQPGSSARRESRGSRAPTPRAPAGTRAARPDPSIWFRRRWQEQPPAALRHSDRQPWDSAPAPALRARSAAKPAEKPARGEISNCRYAIERLSGDHQCAVSSSSSSGYTQSSCPFSNVSEPFAVRRVTIFEATSTV